MRRARRRVHRPVRSLVEREDEARPDEARDLERLELSVDALQSRGRRRTDACRTPRASDAPSPARRVLDRERCSPNSSAIVATSASVSVAMSASAHTRRAALVAQVRDDREVGERVPAAVGRMRDGCEHVTVIMDGDGSDVRAPHRPLRAAHGRVVPAPRYDRDGDVQPLHPTDPATSVVRRVRRATRPWSSSTPSDTGPTRARVPAQHRTSTTRPLDWLSDFEPRGEIVAVDDGTVVLGDEPILEITAPLPGGAARSRPASSTSSITRRSSRRRPRVSRSRRRDVPSSTSASGARTVCETGVDASLAAYVGGGLSTSNVEAGRRYGIPVVGTMAHSFVQAFTARARRVPCVRRGPSGRLRPARRHLRHARRRARTRSSSGRRCSERGQRAASRSVSTPATSRPGARRARRCWTKPAFRRARSSPPVAWTSTDIDALVTAGAPIDAYRRRHRPRRLGGPSRARHRLQARRLRRTRRREAQRGQAIAPGSEAGLPDGRPGDGRPRAPRRATPDGEPLLTSGLARRRRAADGTSRAQCAPRVATRSRRCRTTGRAHPSSRSGPPAPRLQRRGYG